MRELGDDTEKFHILLAQDILDQFPHGSNISFYLVGPNMQKYVLPMLESVFPTISSLSSRDLGKQIHEKIVMMWSEVPMIYVKGSQNTIFLEEGIKQFIDPTEDIARLCRQSDDWKKKKEAFFMTVE